MTLRANITTTYRGVNASPPRAIKNARKEAADQGVHESEGTGSPMKPAMKAPDRGGVPIAEHWGDRSAVRSKGQTSETEDAFELSSPRDKSIMAQGFRPNNPVSGWRPDANEPRTASNPSLPGFAPGSEEPIAMGNVEESPVREISSSDEHLARGPLNQLLPLAATPKIRLADPSVNAATGSTATSPPAHDVAAGTVSDEGEMQRDLIAALHFGRAEEDSSQTDTPSGGDVAKHLQSEGVFGISASGRNLGTVDFIRQKQFEYAMDQKPFTTDDLLLEAEKAIHGTLNSDQSSAVSKSLLQVAESVNAYRNQSVKSSEHAEIATEPIRTAASTGKEET